MKFNNDELFILQEVIEYEIDWESDEDRNRYYEFRNRVEGLMDKYYQGGS